MSPSEVRPDSDQGHAVGRDIERYRYLIAPRSITVVGATNNLAAVGGRVYANLIKDFPGELYAVNPARTMIQDRPCAASLDDVPSTDLVVVITPSEQVPDVLRTAVKRGSRSAMVISSGFAEMGGHGVQLQNEIGAIARDHDFPVLGPNVIGLYNAREQVMATFAGTAIERPKPSPVAVVSQSGGFGSYILSKTVLAGVDVGTFVSTGNEADVTASRMLRYLVEQPDIRVVLMFTESMSEPDAFLEAADRAIATGKVIVALKARDSEAAARAAQSHTASLVGSSVAFSAVCRQYGVLRAFSVDDMVDIAKVLATGRRMAGRRVAIVTASGGAGVLASGEASSVGLDVPELPAAVQHQLSAYIPDLGSTQNPVDTTAQVSKLPEDTYQKVLECVAMSDAVDAVLALTWTDTGRLADAVIAAHASQPKPIVPVVVAGGGIFAAAGIAAFADPVAGMRALGRLAGVSESLARGSVRREFELVPNRRKAARRLIASAAATSVVETIAKKVLALYDIPVVTETMVTSEDEAAQVAEQMSGALVMKVVSSDVPHKSDVGGVLVGVKGSAEAREAYGAIYTAVRERVPDANLLGVLVQPLVHADLEMMCGFHRDSSFGPIVVVGLGGTLAEIVGEVSLLRAPCSYDEALRAIAELAGGRLLTNVRGLSAAQHETVANIVCRMANLACELPEVLSLDVNPLRVGPNGIVAVDALLEIAG